MGERKSLVRTHMVVPQDLVRAVDELVGKRKRSAFFAQAVREKLSRAALLAALEETAGSIKPEDHPEWTSTESVVAWVERIREEDKKRLFDK
ncbi:MAG: hypothetical protein ACUVWR_15095 [Anaerolineae bacterium]